jgi:hypothetical protein
MRVPWVRRFERDSGAAHLQDDIDDVLELNVAVVRAGVIAPAEV